MYRIIIIHRPHSSLKSKEYRAYLERYDEGYNHGYDAGWEPVEGNDGYGKNPKEALEGILPKYIELETSKLG